MAADTERKRIAYLYKIYRQSERASKKAILNVIERRPHGRLLDCGCGDGEFTVRVASRARVSEAYGIECIDDRIREATDRGVIVTKGDLNDPLPYKSRFFNILHAHHIIEHLLNIDLFLQEMKRVLRPDGYAILSLNNLASWRDRFSPVPARQALPLDAPSDAMVGNAFHWLQAMDQPSQGDSRLLVSGSQELTRLCHYHGFWVERLTFASYYPPQPQPAHLVPELDTAHVAFLIAKLRPRL